MGSLIDELKRREAAARAEELRGRIAQLTERLAQADERVSRLVIARLRPRTKPAAGPSMSSTA